MELILLKLNQIFTDLFSAETISVDTTSCSSYYELVLDLIM